MAHIQVPPEVPGIVSLMMAYPKTAVPMNALAEILLREPSPLAPGERELIAARTSYGNECFFCQASHSAAAAEFLNASMDLVKAVKVDYTSAAVSPKMKALLAISDKVRKDGRTVTPEDIKRVRDQGATDPEIHHTVLITAAFCMCNRYVDGLATLTPRDEAAYALVGKLLATVGYENAIAVQQQMMQGTPPAAPEQAPPSKR